MTDKEENRTEQINTEESTAPELNELQMKAAALAYARYLKAHGLEPGGADVVLGREPENDTEGEADEEPYDEEFFEEEFEEEAVEASEEEESAAEEDGDEASDGVPYEDKQKKKKKAKQKKAKARAEKRSGKRKADSGEYTYRKSGLTSLLAAAVDAHDKVQEGIDATAERAGKGVAKWAHASMQTYRNSRRTIGYAILFIGLLAASLLIIFDRFTVYEYAYNGKVLGYVSEQEEVTDVLDIAGIKLTQNNISEEAGVEFVANQNVTFNEVDGRGKSTDDADTAVNKLIYMTDIETEAYGIYDGDRVVAIVKSSEDGEELLDLALADLSAPDNGMELVSAEYTNELAIKPINVLLSAVQSKDKARKQMVEGGEMETFHIVEEGETVESLAALFGVDVINIYDENNSDIVTEIEQGDRVCIRNTVEPVSVKMVEKGRLKEVVEYDTIKKESDEYYKGDTYIKQEGRNGLQIFEGTITKVGGEVTERDEDNIEVIRKKKNKIIIVGTAERPKTAPTGTFAMPIQGATVTSEFGHRWGRLHAGMDFGASTGTPIYASDGGTVVRASYYGGYGNCIDIDNGPGRETRYAHCSRILVRAGEQVYQGQLIGLVGNTGNSFGSHLHFEIHINGSATNPRPYLGM